jgi:tetratricopeptide (TPR) repeat protein
LNNAVEAIVRLHFMRRGEYEAALAFIEEHIARAREIRDDTLEFVLHGSSIGVLVKLGRYGQALSIARAAPHSEVNQLFGTTVWASILSVTGLMLAGLGQFDEARASIEAGLRLVESGGTPADVAWKWAHLAWVDLIQGEQTQDAESLRQGVAQAHRALSVLRERENEEDWIEILHVAARLHFLLGHLDEAIALSTEVIQLSAGMPSPPYPELYRFTHSQILRRLGRDVEADSALRSAHERVMLVAAKLQDEALRRSWLEDAWLIRDIVQAVEHVE